MKPNSIKLKSSLNKPLYFLFNFIIVTAFFSCTFFETKKAEDAIAKVGTQYLFKEDLPKFEISSSNPEDSITATKRFIDQWALKQIMLNKAKFNLPEQQQQKFEEMANQYREQLYINAYKDALVEKNFQFNINEDSLVFEEWGAKELSGPRALIKNYCEIINDTTFKIFELKYS